MQQFNLTGIRPLHSFDQSRAQIETVITCDKFEIRLIYPEKNKSCRDSFYVNLHCVISSFGLKSEFNSIVHEQLSDK